MQLLLSTLGNIPEGFDTRAPASNPLPCSQSLLWCIILPHTLQRRAVTSLLSGGVWAKDTGMTFIHVSCACANFMHACYTSEVTCPSWEGASGFQDLVCMHKPCASAEHFRSHLSFMRRGKWLLRHPVQCVGGGDVMYPKVADMLASHTR